MQCSMFMCRSCTHPKETKMFTRLSSQQSTVVSNWNLPISKYLFPTNLLSSSKWILLERYVCIDISICILMLMRSLTNQLSFSTRLLCWKHPMVQSSKAMLLLATVCLREIPYYSSVNFSIQFKSSSLLFLQLLDSTVTMHCSCLLPLIT